MGAPVCLQKAVPGSKENAAVERREVNAHRHGRAPQGVSMLPAPFGAPLPSHFVRESSPLVSEGMEMPGAPRALREQGRRSFDFLMISALAVWNVNRMIAHERSRAFWRNEPNALACATLVLKPPP